MKLKITASPQHATTPRLYHGAYAEVRYVDEFTSGGELGVKVGLAVLAAIDNMRRSGLDACDPHWSILLTIRRVEREDGGEASRTVPS